MEDSQQIMEIVDLTKPQEEFVATMETENQSTPLMPPSIDTILNAHFGDTDTEKQDSIVSTPKRSREETPNDDEVLNPAKQSRPSSPSSTASVEYPAPPAPPSTPPQQQPHILEAETLILHDPLIMMPLYTVDTRIMDHDSDEASHESENCDFCHKELALGLRFLDDHCRFEAFRPSIAEKSGHSYHSIERVSHDDAKELFKRYHRTLRNAKLSKLYYFSFYPRRPRETDTADELKSAPWLVATHYVK